MKSNVYFGVVRRSVKQKTGRFQCFALKKRIDILQLIVIYIIYFSVRTVFPVMEAV